MQDVTLVSPLSDHRLYVEFDSGEKGIFDMKPYLSIGQYRQLQDERLFNQVYVDCFTATWPGGIDIAPERIYNELQTA